MVAIKPGKWTHDRSEGLVVFLVGMRVNRPAKVRTWWPTFTAMPRMLRELYTDPQSGFLGATTTLSGRGALVVTYWKDLEALMAYAHDAGAEHRPAWTAFNRSARESAGVVGIWHETFVVPPGGHESLYVDMPQVGLPKATSGVEVTSRRDNARARLTQGGAEPR
jgi:hypothetical protein